MDWSELPTEIVYVIARKITTIVDYLRFRAVCKPWRSATQESTRHLPPQAPWLLLPYDVNSAARSFLSVPDRNVHRLLLPEARGRRCFGFDHGWLVTMGLEPDVNLLNPLTRAQVELPPVTTIPQVLNYDSAAAGREYKVHYMGDTAWWSARDMRDAFFYKVVLSANPAVAGRDCVAMAFHSHNERVAFCRVGDARWTVVETGLYDMPVDARYFKGKFYALSVEGRVAVWEGQPAGKVRSVLAFEGFCSSHKFYFVETSGKLLVMRVGLREDGSVGGAGRRKGFHFVEMESRPKVRKIRGVGDAVTLFVDGQHCLAFSGGRALGFEENHVYTFKNLYSQDSEFSQGSTHNIYVANMGGDGAAMLLPFTWQPDVPVEKAPFLWEDFLGGQRAYVWFTPSLC